MMKTLGLESRVKNCYPVELHDELDSLQLEFNPP